MLEEQPYVVVHLVRLNLVEDEHVGCFCQQREAEAFPDTQLWATGDEEFDVGDLRHKLPKDRQGRRNRFLVVAFVQGIHDDDG